MRHSKTCPFGIRISSSLRHLKNSRYGTGALTLTFFFLKARDNPLMEDVLRNQCYGTGTRPGVNLPQAGL